MRTAPDLMSRNLADPEKWKAVVIELTAAFVLFCRALTEYVQDLSGDSKKIISCVAFCASQSFIYQKKK